MDIVFPADVLSELCALRREVIDAGFHCWDAGVARTTERPKDGLTVALDGGFKLIHPCVFL